MMAIIIRILIGIVLAALGLFVTFRTRSILDFFGGIDYVDEKLGPDGSNLVYKLIGIAVTFAGFMWATNLWDAFLAAVLGSFLIRRG